ncbi:acyl-CoA-binding protein-like [Centruroides sculpturatus]|uniref:acyl-CoA-binding protein-like n=1 Tax=Centruroides sculpturatus TaxID=218467 RepID=UPI000C6E28FE|nr:acyl-CoA-binding protein-like [Centruroides sculpturatus]
MSLDESFNKAAEDVKNLKSRPTDQELLELYALYKQATIGDCNTSRPGMLDLKGKAKWEAWNGKKGMSQNDAKEAYVKYASELIAKYGN